MKNYLIIQEGKAVNAITADSLEHAQEAMPGQYVVEVDLQVEGRDYDPGVGWLYDGTSWTAPEIIVSVTE